MEAYGPALWDKLGWSYKKNVELTKDMAGKRLYVRMNNYGYRTHDFLLPKPKNTYRIICMGGSTTVEGATNDSTYPAILERKLQDHFRSNGIEVINCGVSGLSSGQEKKKIKELVRLEPDLLIEYNAVNDIFAIMLLNWKNTRNQLWKTIVWKSALAEKGFFALYPPSEGYARNFFETYTIPNLQAIYDEVRAKDIDIVFCTFIAPDIAELSYNDRAYFDYTIKHYWFGRSLSIKDYCNYVSIYNDCLKNMCKRNGIKYIELGECFRGGIDEFTDAAHLSPKGIERKAVIIFEYLKSGKIFKGALLARHAREIINVFCRYA